MSSLAAVRTAVITTLGLHLPGVKLYRRVPASVILPCVIVMPALADYLVTHGNGGTMWDLDLHVLVSSTDEDVAQEALDQYIAPIGDKSIVRIIHENPTLGADNISALVVRLTAYGFQFAVSGDQHIGATLRMQALTTNS